MTFIRQYAIFFQYALLLLAIFFISRFFLVYRYDTGVDFLFFIYALRMDIIAISALLVLPILLYTINFVFLSRLLLTFSLFIVTYLEVANYFFFEEFNTKLNYLFVEYLAYPKEVLDMIITSYGWILLFLIPALLYLSYRFFILTKSRLVPSKILSKIYALPIIIVLLFLGIRSSIDQSTPNQSFYSYSNSPLKNDIVNNTLFSLGYSIYLKKKETLPDFGKKVQNAIAQIQKIEPQPYENNNSLLHFQKSTFGKKSHIVLALMESFGSSYVGIQGGTPTTPFFDAMTKRGLFLSNMYSSSNRSNRGFEATLGSLFPVYPDSYLKLPKSINNFWTIAKTLKKNGYKCIFLYGGDSKFDNMKGFALNNGFDEVLDKYNFEGSVKRYTWGVSDEALYEKAYEILNKTDEPIFLVTFSLSSHKPFDYPEGKIEPYDQEPVASFANSIKYADYALHQFYSQLKKEDFFDDGLLTIVADHNAHMFGDEKIPVNEFKIPALFITHDLTPKTIESVTHQIDIAPTLLDIAGVDATTPAMGVDLTKTESSKALIIHHGAFAYLKDNAFVLYQQKQEALVYDFDYQRQESNLSLIEEGLAYIYGSYAIYDNQRHKGSDEK